MKPTDEMTKAAVLAADLTAAAWQMMPTTRSDDEAMDALMRAALSAALNAAPTVTVYEPENDNVAVWACMAWLTNENWAAASRKECEAQGCDGPHRTLIVGGEV